MASFERKLYRLEADPSACAYDQNCTRRATLQLEVPELPDHLSIPSCAVGVRHRAAACPQKRRDIGRIRPPKHCGPLTCAYSAGGPTRRCGRQSTRKKSMAFSERCIWSSFQTTCAWRSGGILSSDERVLADKQARYLPADCNRDPPRRRRSHTRQGACAVAPILLFEDVRSNFSGVSASLLLKLDAAGFWGV
jgi:hypothetical protein